ncbi:MAG TPA: hypothetical protein VKP10_08900 [Gemmatimonadales bacterium]|nr:hypothetical protein [Gemmatimonadales bacterium]
MLLSLLLWQTSTITPVIELTGRFQSPRVTESSGVAVSRAHRGTLWTHNDSGDGPYLFATDLRGADRGAIRVSGARAVDWEDIALGPCPLAGRQGACLYIGDTGDNLERRRSVTVYAVPEPDPPTSPADTQRVTAAALALSVRYPDGSHDVEAMYVSPRDTAVYLISKGRGGTIRLYRAGRDTWQSPRPVTVQLIQTLPIVPKARTGRRVTDAAIRPDGALVAVRTYNEIYFFTPGPGGRLTPSGHPCALDRLGRVGEGIAFLDDETVVLTSEGNPLGPGAIHTVRCAR